MEQVDDDDVGYGADGLSWEAVLQCVQVCVQVCAQARVWWYVSC